jgi:thiamine pyrophosphokinase
MGPDPGRATRDVIALVFAGGDPPDVRDLPASLQPELVVAADSGLAHALALGVAVDLVVGDLDSVDPTVLDAAIADGTTVERHPAEKDTTDLELALDAALARGATWVIVLGVHGGRFDHFLANMLLLASPQFAAAQIEARLDGTNVSVVRDSVGLAARAGALCTLLPVGGPAIGVTTEGLRYPLRGETLPPGTTRGVSNEFIGSTAAVSLESGVLLAVIPASGNTDFEKDA